MKKQTESRISGVMTTLSLIGLILSAEYYPFKPLIIIFGIMLMIGILDLMK